MATLRVKYGVLPQSEGCVGVDGGYQVTSMRCGTSMYPLAGPCGNRGRSMEEFGKVGSWGRGRLASV